MPSEACRFVVFLFLRPCIHELPFSLLVLIPVASPSFSQLIVILDCLSFVSALTLCSSFFSDSFEHWRDYSCSTWNIGLYADFTLCRVALLILFGLPISSHFVLFFHSSPFTPYHPTSSLRYRPLLFLLFSTCFTIPSFFFSFSSLLSPFPVLFIPASSLLVPFLFHFSFCS